MTGCEHDGASTPEQIKQSKKVVVRGKGTKEEQRYFFRTCHCCVFRRRPGCLALAWLLLPVFQCTTVTHFYEVAAPLWYFSQRHWGWLMDTWTHWYLFSFIYWEPYFLVCLSIQAVNRMVPPATLNRALTGRMSRNLFDSRGDPFPTLDEQAGKSSVLSRRQGSDSSFTGLGDLKVCNTCMQNLSFFFLLEFSYHFCVAYMSNRMQNSRKLVKVLLQVNLVVLSRMMLLMVEALQRYVLNLRPCPYKRMCL